MSKALCSVVMSTFDRCHLLARSLVCYEKQDFDNERFELIIVDDSSTDDTYELVHDWSHRTNIKLTYLSPYPKLTGWRDCAATINHGIRVSQGTHILLTHPEIMVGRTSIKDCVDKLEEFDYNRKECERIRGDGSTPYGGIGLYSCCKCYYLSPKDQKLIDTVPWECEGAIAVRQIDRFYEDDINGHPDFCHRATDLVATPGARIPTWESWIFGGHSRETWKRLGGMLPTQAWGSCDVGWMHRRQMLGINNYTCPTNSSIVTHQNHDLSNDIKTPRVEQVWKDELAKMNLGDPNKLIYPYINEIGW